MGFTSDTAREAGKKSKRGRISFQKKLKIFFS